jgi:hypothetical protein
MQEKVGEYIFSKVLIDHRLTQIPEELFVANVVGTFLEDKDCVLVIGDEKHLNHWISDTDLNFNKAGICVVIHKDYIIGPASKLMKELV